MYLLRQWSATPARLTILCSLSGALAALGQAPWGFWPVALVGYAMGLWALSQSVRPFRDGWVFGAVHFATALHWIVEPFFVEPQITGWLAPFGILGLAGGLALIWAVAVALAHRIFRGRAFGLALLLALAEYVRGFLLTGFPWAAPGHIWINTGALPTASIWGPLGLTMATLLIAASLADLRWRGMIAGGAGSAALIVLGTWLAQGEVDGAANDPVVRLIQPNAPQHLKWRADMIPVFFDRALDLTAAPPGDEGPAILVMWPETTLPQFLGRSEQTRTLIAQASDGAQVLLGAQRFDDLDRPRNIAALLGTDGSVGAIYDKHHLVPFGEYLPLAPVLGALGLRGFAEHVTGRYASGDGPRNMPIEGIGDVFVMICYEAIFPRYVRQVERPRVMAHLTNDAWFGTFAGPQQHLALARLRAAEQRLPVIRAANTGISAVINSYGAIQASLSLGQSGYLDAPLPPALRPGPYARYGDGLPIGALALMMVFLFVWYWPIRY